MTSLLAWINENRWQQLGEPRAAGDLCDNRSWVDDSKGLQRPSAAVWQQSTGALSNRLELFHVRTTSVLSCVGTHHHHYLSPNKLIQLMPAAHPKPGTGFLKEYLITLMKLKPFEWRGQVYNHVHTSMKFLSAVNRIPCIKCSDYAKCHPEILKRCNPVFYISM